MQRSCNWLVKARKCVLRLGAGGRRWMSSDTAGRRYAAVWGNGDYGRLGLGSLDSQWRPKPVLHSSLHDLNLKSIACGGAHSLFLTESGVVYATGLNDFGQLGAPEVDTYSMIPLKVPGLPKEIVHISAGYHHSCAITVDGEVYMWGRNSSGQLGLGKKAKKILPAPTKVECLAGITIKTVALASEHSVAVTDNLLIYMRFIILFLGLLIPSCFGKRKTSGVVVWCKQSLTFLFDCLYSPPDEGQALSWGGGGSGRLGHACQSSFFGILRNTSEFTPRNIKKLEGVKVKTFAAGLLHSACIDEYGSVYVFGEKGIGKLGSGNVDNAAPSMIDNLRFSEDIACGGYHTCVVTSGGELYAWDSNENGCLGISSTEVSHLPERVKGPFLKSPVDKVSCGWKHTAAISGGNIFTWGWGGAQGTFSEDGQSSGGQLGHGNDVDYNSPTMVVLGKNVKALQVSCGFNHTGAILESTET